jgi:hypothetical protein
MPMTCPPRRPNAVTVLRARCGWISKKVAVVAELLDQDEISMGVLKPVGELNALLQQRVDLQRLAIDRVELVAWNGRSSARCWPGR